eukprot:6221511-Amphidinium_carterae.1
MTATSKTQSFMDILCSKAESKLQPSISSVLKYHPQGGTVHCRLHEFMSIAPMLSKRGHLILASIAPLALHHPWMFPCVMR